MRKALIISAIAAILAIPLPGRAAVGSSSVFHCEMPARNLLVNGGAEAAGRALAGWNVHGGMMSARYGTATDLPTAASHGPKGRGARFFAGGPGPAAESSATQRIDLSPFTRLIDNNQAEITLRACMGGSGKRLDQASVRIEFRDSNGALFGGGQIGAVGAWERRERTGLVPHVLVGLIPEGAASVTVVITATRAEPETAFNTAAVDNVSVVITDQRAKH